jgi:DNA-directed RNA polymerase subunit RPC12/RpoP
MTWYEFFRKPGTVLVYCKHCWKKFWVNPGTLKTGDACPHCRVGKVVVVS